MIKKIQAVDDGRTVTADVDAKRYSAFDSLYNNAALRVAVGDDNAAMAFLVSQLAYTENKLFEKKYQPMQFEEFIPLDSSAGEWTDVIRYEIYDFTGQGKPVNWKSTAVNKVDVGFAQKSFPVVYGSVGYDYSQEELRRTAYLQRALPERKLNAAMTAYRRHLNAVGLQGEPDTGLTGLYNNPNVPQGNAPTGKWSAATGAATADQMVADLNFAIQKVWENTQYNETPDTLVVAPAAFNKMVSTARSTYSDTSVLKFFKENNIAKLERGIDINIQPGYALNTAGVGGTGRVIAYCKTPEHLVMHIPLPLRFLAPQFSGLSIDVAGEYKYSGVEIRYPKSVFYMDGV